MARPPPKELLAQRPVLVGEPNISHPLTNPTIGQPPRKYTRALHERICEELAKGQRPQGACARAGITIATFYNWIAMGKAGNPHLYEFAQDVEIAYNTAEANAVDAITQSYSSTDPEARDVEKAQWFLERARPDGYSKQVKTAVEGQIQQFLQRLEAALEPDIFERVLAVYLGQAPAADLGPKALLEATSQE